MKSRVIKALAIVSVFTAALAPAGAQAEWLRADTKHFILYSDGREAELTKFAVEAEKFDSLLRSWFKVGEHEDAIRLPVFIMKDSETVSKLRGVEKGALGGFYQALPEGAYALSNRAKPVSKFSGTGQQILFHEYTHHFFTRYVSGSYPTWLFEGFAEYFSTTTFDKDDSYTVGNIANSRAYGLTAGQNLPIERILTDGLTGLNRQQTDVYYGRSWLLTHHLMSDAAGRAQLSEYVKAFNSGTPPREAAESTFGPFEKLDQDLVALTRKGMVAFSSKEPIGYDPTVRITPLDTVDSELLELHINRIVQFQPDETLSKLRALAAIAPDRVGVLAELARAELETARKAGSAEATAIAVAAAEGTADKVLALDPDNVSAAMTKGLAILEHDDGNPSDEDVAAARKMFVKANNADPEEPRPLYEYFRSYAQYSGRPPDIAIQGLEAAFTKAPEIVDYRVALAFAYANLGRFDEAMSLVRYLAYHPHMAEHGKRLIEQLEKMREQREEFEKRLADAEEEESED
ncbi:hypothetical protein GRI89_03460 [Altererythrobacter salegens]|uniref:DUF1570 domain-containing protein n=1 Tax=Croceibacterium salegens TaxID=1737568 RepID=A0A6I4SST4_9SPHN|nr:hypothetical protein [Croceibacterium salegens]MXO58599.1 hypothetical protein [Croceibacterium salegens]